MPRRSCLQKALWVSGPPWHPALHTLTQGFPPCRQGQCLYSGVEGESCMKPRQRNRPFKLPPIAPHIHLGREGGGILWPQRSTYFLPPQGKRTTSRMT